jgi:hypothetical protein
MVEFNKTLIEIEEEYGFNGKVQHQSWGQYCYMFIVGRKVRNKRFILEDSNNGDIETYHPDKKEWRVYQEPKKKVKVWKFEFVVSTESRPCIRLSRIHYKSIEEAANHLSGVKVLCKKECTMKEVEED